MIDINLVRNKIEFDFIMESIKIFRDTESTQIKEF